jgi:hypothetical protein
VGSIEYLIHSYPWQPGRLKMTFVHIRSRRNKLVNYKQDQYKTMGLMV